MRVLIHLQSWLAITCSGLPVPITWELLVPIVDFGQVNAGWDCDNWGRCLEAGGASRIGIYSGSQGI